MSDLARAFNALKGKQSKYATLNDYYNGNAPLVYASEEFRAQFTRLTARFSENWAAVVIDSLLDRLSLQGFKLDDTSASDSIENLWDELDLSLDSDEICRDVSITGEAFLMIERKEDGSVNAFANPPHLCHAFYCEDDPREMAFAAKWFDRGGEAHLTLYYTDVLVHYVAKKQRSEVDNVNAFTLDPEFEQGIEVNEFSRIPLFHFQRDRTSLFGELQNVIPLQNALNKLFADMMVSAEFGAAPQRYAIIDSMSADQADLKNGPNKIWKFAYDAEGSGRPQVGQFEATQLNNFLVAIDHIATKIAVITRTPKHFLLQQGDVSGEALIAMEAPLNRKAKKYTSRLGVTWRQCAKFILELQGFSVEANDIEPIWEDVRTIQPLTESVIRVNNSKAGIPIDTQLEREGWTDDEIEEMHSVEDANTSRMTDAASVARDAALARFNAGQVPGVPNATPQEGMETEE